MDSLTHLVAGALTPIAFRGSPKRAAVIAFGVAVGELPDIDIFFGRDTEALLSLHRGITHALFAQPVMILLAVIPFYLWLQNRAAPLAAGPGRAPAGPPPLADPGGFGFLTMCLAALFAVYTHIYLDCMTTFGTQIFLPFSRARVGFPAMFIVDLLLTLPALALLVKALRAEPERILAKDAGRGGKRRSQAVFSGRARRTARIALAWILLYPLAALGVNATLTSALAPRLAPRGGLHLLTEAFSPFVWKVVIDDGRGYRLGTFNIFTPGKELETERYQKPEPLLYETLKRQEPLFGQFENFCNFMVQFEREVPYLAASDYTGKVEEYAFSDLRYLPAPGVAGRSLRDDMVRFSMEARINESGALLAHRFIRRGKSWETPWTILE